MQSPGTNYSSRTLPHLPSRSSSDFSLTTTCSHTLRSNFCFRLNSPFSSRSSSQPPAIRLCPQPPQIYVPWKPVRQLFLRVIPRDVWTFHHHFDPDFAPLYPYTPILTVLCITPPPWRISPPPTTAKRSQILRSRQLHRQPSQRCQPIRQILSQHRSRTLLHPHLRFHEPQGRQTVKN